MPARKTTWPCGHVGKGQSCARCRQEQQVAAKKAEARVAEAEVAAGDPYTDLGGKRWESDRNVVSVPIGWGYRLLLRDEGGSLRPHAVMTHEQYNGLRPGQIGGRRG